MNELHGKDIIKDDLMNRSIFSILPNSYELNELSYILTSETLIECKRIYKECKISEFYTQSEADSIYKNSFKDINDQLRFMLNRMCLKNIDDISEFNMGK